jgi:putative phosphoesterase
LAHKSIIVNKGADHTQNDMKVIVLSDTHARHIAQLPPALLNAMMKTDYILHLGDFDTRELVEDLKRLNNFRGVTGNHDFEDITCVLPRKDIIEIGGKRIGLIHGHKCSVPLGIQHGMRSRFKKEKLDAILYGHTHIPTHKVVGDMLFFNPGSACGRFPAYRKSYGQLTINGSIRAELLPLSPYAEFNKLPEIKSAIKQIVPRKYFFRTE